jgi:hypothetical protein
VVFSLLPVDDLLGRVMRFHGEELLTCCDYRVPEDRPTAAILLNNSDFCIPDPHYDFMNTELAAKLRSAGMISLGE